MARINLLFIAPYPELALIAERAARAFSDVKLTVHTGDLDEGVRQALVDYHIRFDAIISRGGTADTLEEELSIPVVKMQLTAREILSSLAKANPHGERMAAVGFHSIFEELRELLPLLPYPVDIFGVDFDDEVPAALSAVTAKGYPAVLCDTIAFKQATQRGMSNCRLLESDEESVGAAIEQASSICHIVEHERRTNLLLWHVIRDLDADVAVFDEKGQLTYTSIPGGEEGHGVLDYISEHRASAADGARLLVRRGGFTFDIRARAIVVAGVPYTVFSIKRTRASTEHTGIDFLSADKVSEEYERSVFATVGAAGALGPVIRRGIRSSAPLLLEGEVGSGKDQVARLIYLEGRFRSRPFVQVSCDLLNERSWRFLIKSHQSPLFRSDITVYLRGLNALDADRWRDLLSVIRDSSLTSRSRLIMSCSDGADGRTCDAAVRFAEQLRCTVLIVPPLRAAADVPDRLQRYLDRLAREERAPSPTIEPEARELAARASWPYNFLQLREVAERLFAVHGSRPISEHLMRDALARRERIGSSVGGVRASFLFNETDVLPLSETERIAAQAALEHFGGNKTKAAHALGISRTTLWRLLSE